MLRNLSLYKKGKMKQKTLISQTDSIRRSPLYPKVKDYGERKHRKPQALLKTRTNAKNLVKILIHLNDPSSWFPPGTEPHQKH